MSKVLPMESPSNDETTSPCNSPNRSPATVMVMNLGQIPKQNSRRDYVHRRRMMWSNNETSAICAEIRRGAISRLPISLQVAFRRKMLTIFALQLFFVWGAVGVLTYCDIAKDAMNTAFKGQYWFVILSCVMVVVLLWVLYLLRNRFPLNWCILLLFSLTESVTFAGLGVLFKTDLGFFNCCATFCCVAIMIALAGVRVKGKYPEKELISFLKAGLIAYTIVALASTVIFVMFGRDFITPLGFGYSLAFQFIVLLWFSWDASCMSSVMSTDEYMQGVIYFYTDIVVIAIICLVVVGLVASISVIVAGGGGGGGCSVGSCTCGGSCGSCGHCTDTYCPCCAGDEDDPVAEDTMERT